MRKIGLLTLVTVIGMKGYAASIDHIQTYTPEYFGNQAINGLINNTSVYYNPAGLVRLKDGLYVHGGLQLATGYEKMEYKGKEYKADLLQPIPNFALYKVKNNKAIFWTFGGLAGGGELKYKNGVPGTAVVPEVIPELIPQSIPGIPAGVANISIGHSQVEGKHIYVQNTLGGTFAYNDKLSFSVAGRVVFGVRKLKGEIDDVNLTIPVLPVMYQDKIDIDSERTAVGFGGQFGINYKVNDKLNLALRYDTRVNLNFKAKGNEQTFKAQLRGNTIDTGLGFSKFFPEYKDGKKQRRDLPAILALGGSYKITDNWLLGISGNYYFNKDAKMDRVSGGSTTELNPQYDNGWEIAIGTEYAFNDRWSILGSVNYARTGAKSSSYDDVEYALNSVTLGTGVKYKPNDTLEWVFTVAHFIYESDNGNYPSKYPKSVFKTVENPKYSKSITGVGIGFTKRF